MNFTADVARSFDPEKSLRLKIQAELARRSNDEIAHRATSEAEISLLRKRLRAASQQLKQLLGRSLFQRIRNKPPRTVKPLKAVENGARSVHAPEWTSGEFSVDVAIVTNLRFPGGNASSTLDEVRYFTSIGLSVLLVHIPVGNSKKGMSGRYARYAHMIALVKQIETLKARLIIVRGPRVVLENEFAQLVPKVSCERSAFIVNNSAYRPSGEEIFPWAALLARIEGLKSWNPTAYPLGPAIRSEAISHGIAAERLGSFDWTPTFDTSSIKFSPKKFITYPVVIGRHGRDGDEKWIENPADLLNAYPDDNDFFISVLGGADKAAKRVGILPENWICHPFGSMEVSDFLSCLDVFVYFPHSQLNEAFGRTIMEAMFAGVPCVLPHRFSETFADLAFYCTPDQVKGVVSRLISSNDKRTEFVATAREIIIDRFESAVLMRRAPEFSSEKTDVGIVARTLPPHLAEYKRWVELG